MVEKDISDGGRFSGKVSRGIGALIRGFLPSGASFWRYAERNFGQGGGTEYDGPPADDPRKIAVVGERLARLDEWIQAREMNPGATAIEATIQSHPK